VFAALLLLAFANGSTLSDFSLNKGAETVVVSPEKSSATVLVFVSAVCPVSDKYVDRLNALYRDFAARGVRLLMVNSNHNESWEDVARYTVENGLAYPMYKDYHNRLADRVGALKTPEAFVYDSKGILRYRGQIDDASNAARVRTHSLHDALEAVLRGITVEQAETRTRGCTIHRVKR
jgi:alkyl hydroperoxide reductase subunit AhpC